MVSDDGITFVDEALRLPIEVCGQPLRVRTVRLQLDEMERIRDFVATLPMHDRKRWVAALKPLTDALLHDLAAQEGTGTLGAVLLAGYTAYPPAPTPDSENGA